MVVSRDASGPTARVGDVGRTLGGRYRLVAPLGTGASATVYLAEDLLLARHVAVKVLHPTLASDASFLRRFRAEAQAAAALNHPNVVAVFDWGTDPTLDGADGAPFLVTEHLAGGSLRAMLDRGRLLTPSQALLVGLEASRGLEFAHARGLVHRDVKPANLLFGDDGRLRIADFGLARAIAEAAWTEPDGVVLGTARYASPEQAKGMPVDGRSDVYSLALTLIEAVTGAVPFAADTTVATLMGRIDRLMPVSAELGQLAPVLERAGRPDPTERSDAAELSRGLVQAARFLSRPAPLPLVRSSSFELDVSPTSVSPATVVAAGHGPPPVGVPSSPAPPANGSGAPSASSAPPAAPDAGAAAAIPSRPPSPSTAAAPAAAVAPSPAPAVTGASTRRHRPRRWLLAFAVAVLAGLAAVGVLVLRPGGPSAFAVADYRGRPFEQVQNEVGMRWEVRTEDRNDEERAVGTVVHQSPESGTSLRKDGVLTLWLSKGPAPRALPEVGGLPQAEAEATLLKTGLAAKVVGEQYDEKIATGSIVSWAVADHPDYKAGTEVTKGTEVQLVVSKGPAPVKRPSLKDMTWEQAKAKLEEFGLVAVRQPDEHSDTVAKDLVARAEPTAGIEVPKGSSVNVWISLGPQLFDVPSLVGLSFEEAKAAIVNGGTFTPGSVSGPITGSVVSASPAAGEKRPRGTAIDLTLG